MANTGTITSHGITRTVTSSYKGIQIQTDGSHYYHGGHEIVAWPGGVATHAAWMTSNITPNQYDDCIRKSTYSATTRTWSSPQVVLVPPYGLALVADVFLVASPDGSIWYAYVTGTPDSTGQTNNAIYMASSPDLVNWTWWPSDASPSPVIPYPGSGYGLAEAYVVNNSPLKINGLQACEMWYSDNTAGNFKYLTSTGPTGWGAPTATAAKGQFYSGYLNNEVALAWDGANGISMYLGSGAGPWTLRPNANLATSGTKPLFPLAGQYPRMIRPENPHTGYQAFDYWFTVGAQSPAFGWSLAMGYLSTA